VECIVVGKGKKAAFLRGEKAKKRKRVKKSKRDESLLGLVRGRSREAHSSFSPQKAPPPASSSSSSFFLSLSLDPPFSFFSIPKRVAVTEQKTEKEKNFSL
jgi:hypothetical protein